MYDNLIISKKIKKTLEYVDKITINYSHEYRYLKNNINSSFFNLLELSYKANIFKDINSMKEMIVKIKIIEFYIKKSLDYGLISFKKFINIGEYLLELIKMINAWIKNEKKKQSI